jgi:hypothetical protein
MAHSTHPVMAAWTEEELNAEGCCAGAAEARAWSGLPTTELYRLMNDGLLPWWWHNNVRMIPKRALALILADQCRSAPESVPRPRVAEKKQPA